MSAARRKGNALETEVARLLHEVDGVSPELVQYQTPTGRLGNTYRLQIDVASKRWAVECKNREDNPGRLWTWLGQLESQAGKIGKFSALVLKRNRKPPLVVLSMEDFLMLVGSFRYEDESR